MASPADEPMKGDMLLSIFLWYLVIGAFLSIFLGRSIRYLIEKQKSNPDLHVEFSSLENELQKFHKYTGKYFWFVFDVIFTIFWLPMLMLYVILKLKR